MKFEETALPGVLEIWADAISDERGSFSRIFDQVRFESEGLQGMFPQWSISRNGKRGTIRGLHFQVQPFGETKVVRCISGSVVDVVVDLRPESPAHGKWLAVELTPENSRALYIPRGCAHGFQTLENSSDLLYMIDAPFVADSARRLLWSDPALKIAWPILKDITISTADAEAPTLGEWEASGRR